MLSETSACVMGLNFQKEMCSKEDGSGAETKKIGHKSFGAILDLLKE